MLLDSRLRHVVDEILHSRCTIDVGTDHGKVILTALSEGRTKKGIASDISSDSLAKARALAKRMDIELDTRCGDGLSVLAPNEADTAVIAGMGGREIVKILSHHNESIERLILVPHRDVRLLRRYLVENGYAIKKDYMVLEGSFYYNIIVANVGKDTLTLEEEYLGRNDRDSAVYVDYLEYRLSVVSGILDRVDKSELITERDIIARELEDIRRA